MFGVFLGFATVAPDSAAIACWIFFVFTVFLARAACASDAALVVHWSVDVERSAFATDMTVPVQFRSDSFSPLLRR